MDNDIMKAIEQAAQHAMQNQERMEKESFINKVAMDTAFSMTCNLSNAPLILTSATRPPMETWVEQNRPSLLADGAGSAYPVAERVAGGISGGREDRTRTYP